MDEVVEALRVKHAEVHAPVTITKNEATKEERRECVSCGCPLGEDAIHSYAECCEYLRMELFFERTNRKWEDSQRAKKEAEQNEQ